MAWPTKKSRITITTGRKRIACPGSLMMIASVAGYDWLSCESQNKGGKYHLVCDAKPWSRTQVLAARVKAALLRRSYRCKIDLHIQPY